MATLPRFHAGLLEAVEFRNPARAREDIARLGDGIPERIATRIRLLLAAVPDPDEALHFLEQLRQDFPAAFDRIISATAPLQYLITTFSYSRFLVGGRAAPSGVAVANGRQP